MKTKLIILLLTATSLFSFSQKPEKVKSTFYKYNFELNGNPSLFFMDSTINARFEVDTKSVKFSIENKSNSPMLLKWDLVTMSIFGSSSKAIGEHTKLIDMQKSIPPSVILQKSFYIDRLYPTKNISYQSPGSVGGLSYGGWDVSKIFAIHNHGDTQEDEDIQSQLNKSIIVYLPIEINGKQHDYIFDLKLVSLVPSKKNPY